MVLIRQIRSLCGLTAVVLLGGCDNPFGSRDCTLIGCVGGLRVTLDALPTSSFTITAQAPGQTPEVFSCATPVSCGTVHTFRDFTASEGQIVVTTAQGTLTHPVRPEYRVTYPNGKQCGPECRSASVTVSIPK